ncbi:branched-chain amino acid transport system II carrier protein [Limibacter armeniacum]|uniref:branched-chain amino acid transport system II carrier protein n=1 Tax=Limibacter armeniacum TaxID=466084 RepID=UPI002FE62C20
MNKRAKDTLVLGLAFFATVFGAGNLIFPVNLGNQAGESWLQGAIGFLMSDVGLTVAVLIALFKVGGDTQNFGKRIHPNFGKVIGAVSIICLGPLIAIPRNGALTYELSVVPQLGEINPWLFSIVYFGICLFFVLRPSQILDRLGSILAPILVAVLLYIIYLGVTAPIGEKTASVITNVFGKGITQGYQTLGAVGSVVIGGLFLTNLTRKGYTSFNEQVKISVNAGLVAGVLLAIIYGGLIYVGATTSQTLAGQSNAPLLSTIADRLLGGVGQAVLSITVALACLTSSIGLLAMTGDIFQSISGGKLKYRTTVLVTAAFSTVLAVVGIDKIIVLAGSILTVLYPVIIILTVITFLDSYLTSRKLQASLVLGTFAISLLITLQDLKLINLELLSIFSF